MVGIQKRLCPERLYANEHHNSEVGHVTESAAPTMAGRVTAFMEKPLPAGGVVRDAQPCLLAHFLNLAAERSELGFFAQACLILVL
jgi:hypothetical protein